MCLKHTNLIVSLCTAYNPYVQNTNDLALLIF